MHREKNVKVSGLGGWNVKCPPNSCHWVVLTLKVVEPLGGRALLKEVGHWEWVLSFKSWSCFLSTLQAVQPR